VARTSSIESHKSVAGGQDDAVTKETIEINIQQMSKKLGIKNKKYP